MSTEDPSLITRLIARRNALIAEWVRQTLSTYPESTNRLFGREKDPFRNPVGRTLEDGLTALFDGIVSSTDRAALVHPLDAVIRMRAVQDFTPGNAVAFVFLLKRLLRQELKGNLLLLSAEYAALEDRIDKLALLAFDQYMKCREQIYEIRAHEARRMVFQPERLQQRASKSNAARE